MKLFLNNIKQGLICVVISLFVLLFIFGFATMAWICITTYSFADFPVVLSLILKNAGSYSTLLVGIVVTIFFQMFSKGKDTVERKNEKIKEIGYYTLAFSPPNEQCSPDSYVSIIFDEEDYSLDKKDSEDIRINKEAQVFKVKFYVSREKSVILKNIMAFSDDYFERNKVKIQKNYFKFCQKIEYISPQFCIATPVKSTNYASTNIDTFKYFNIVIKRPDVCINTKNNNDSTRIFWISAITEEGFLMFIKIKSKMYTKENNLCAEICQQTTYYKDGKKLKEVCRY